MTISLKLITSSLLHINVNLPLYHFCNNLLDLEDIVTRIELMLELFEKCDLRQAELERGAFLRNWGLSDGYYASNMLFYEI